MNKLEYYILSISGRDGRGYPSTYDVSTEVNRRIKDGWEPLGAPVFVNDFRQGNGSYMVVQAMQRTVKRPTRSPLASLFAWCGKNKEAV